MHESLSPVGTDPLADRHGGLACSPRTTRPLTGREVARLVRTGSQPTVNAALRRLTEEGILRAQEAGNAYLHTFNREHLAAPAIELLAGIRTELERRLRAEIADWEIAPAHASVFGSAARGDGDARFVLPACPRKTCTGGPSWSGFPTASPPGPATTSDCPRSRQRTCGSFVVGARLL